MLCHHADLLIPNFVCRVWTLATQVTFDELVLVEWVIRPVVINFFTGSSACSETLLSSCFMVISPRKSSCQVNVVGTQLFIIPVLVSSRSHCTKDVPTVLARKPHHNCNREGWIHSKSPCPVKNHMKYHFTCNVLILVGC